MRQVKAGNAAISSKGINMNVKQIAETAIETLESIMLMGCWSDTPSWRIDEINEKISALRTALAEDEMEEYCTKLHMGVLLTKLHGLCVRY